MPVNSGALMTVLLKLLKVTKDQFFSLNLILQSVVFLYFSPVDMETAGMQPDLIFTTHSLEY